MSCNTILPHYFIIIILILFGQAKVFSAAYISSLTIKDQGLLTCIKQESIKQHWQNVNDVHTLKCHGMNITNLQGLAVFKNLQKLSLYNNKLTTIDLSSFSQLEELNIANNKLTYVNLVGLSKLKTLYLFKNKLTYLDFKGLSQLKKIRITHNQLTSLDISPLISLEKAYFFDNKLEDLVVAGLPKLTFIELRQNPMPDEVYDRYDELEGITIIHDGNADDWK